MDKVLYDSLSYYEVLGITPDTRDEELKTKYKELVKLWHPDYNSNPDALEMFQKISQAYEVLKNPDMRLRYVIYDIWKR